MLKEKRLLANKIRGKIREKELIQTDIAKMLKMSPVTFINKLDETNGSRFSANQFVKLMEILDLSDVRSLFEDVES